MKHRDQRGQEQRYAQEDARTSGRHHDTTGSRSSAGGNEGVSWDQQSPNSPRGRNSWNSPGEQDNQSHKSGGAQWERSVEDTRAGSGREYGHGDSGRDLGGRSYWREVGEDARGGGSGAGRGTGGGQRSDPYGREGMDDHRMQGMQGGGSGRHHQEPSAGAYGGESSGSGGYTQRGQRGVGGFGQPQDSFNRHAQEQFGDAGDMQGGSMMGAASQGTRQGHRGKGPKQYTRSDSRVLEDVNERLTEDDDVDASEIEVTCESGVITLQGSVPERWMKHRAEDIAESCSGVKDVENRIRVLRQGASTDSGRSEKLQAGSGQSAGGGTRTSSASSSSENAGAGGSASGGTGGGSSSSSGTQQGSDGSSSSGGSASSGATGSSGSSQNAH